MQRTGCPEIAGSRVLYGLVEQVVLCPATDQVAYHIGRLEEHLQLPGVFGGVSTIRLSSEAALLRIKSAIVGVRPSMPR